MNFYLLMFCRTATPQSSIGRIPPGKPERKKRPAPSPASRDIQNDVSSIERTQSMYIDNKVTLPVFEPRDKPMSSWLSNDHLAMEGSQQSLNASMISYNSQDTGIAETVSNAPSVSTANSTMEPRKKNKRKAPPVPTLAPPSGQVGLNGEFVYCCLCV